MATQYSPKMVTDGLVLYLDAGNRKSYVSSGTTWRDLTTNGNNGTLTNGPTFNSSNGGYIVTDGTNDYVEVATRNTNLEFQPTQAHSAFCWVYNLNATLGIIFGNMDANSPYQGWDLLKNTGTLCAQIITSYPGNAVSVLVNFDYTANTNKWVQIGYTYDGSCPTTSQGSLDSINIYVNGQVVTSGKVLEGGVDGFNTTSETTTYPANQRFRIGSRWITSGVNFPAALNLASTTLYNRALTAREVLQNFNATRGRFGV